MADRSLTRRAMLRSALPLTILPFFVRRLGATVDALAMHDRLRVGVLIPNAAPASTSDGLTLGADESIRTAALFGLDVDVLRQPADSEEETARAARRLLSSGAAALLTAVEPAWCAAVSAVAADHGALALNVACSPTAAEHGCNRFALHVPPGALALRRAREAYRRRSGADEKQGARVVLWHHTLRRFGAEQLNGRFRRRFGREMDSPAWAAWAAIKILTEAALRGRSVEPTGLAAYVRERAARFDGHKGEPLAFDRRTGELRQPLYVVDHGPGRAAGRVAAELSVDEIYGTLDARGESESCDLRGGRAGE